MKERKTFTEAWTNASDESHQLAVVVFNALGLRRLADWLATSIWHSVAFVSVVLALCIGLPFLDLFVL